MTELLDVQALLDPDAATALANFPLDLGSLSDETLPQIRAAMAALPPLELSDRVSRVDHETPDGVVVRLHRPVGVEGPLPCVYWMHGGGLVLGSSTGDDARFDHWCQEFGCAGASVEYRLSPETPYPGPLDDCYAGLRWLATTRPTWAWTGPASASAVPAPGRGSPPAWPSWPAIGRRSAWRSSCSSTR